MTWDRCHVPVTDDLAGVREFQADFDTGSQETVETSTTRRPDAVSLNYLTAHCIGPVAPGDTSQGLLNRVYRVRVENTPGGGGVVYLSRSTVSLPQHFAGEPRAWGPEEQLFSFTGPPVDEIDLAFEQLGRAVVSAERAGHVWIYWFDPREAAYTFTDLGVGRTPRVLLDDAEEPAESDVLLFYASDPQDCVAMRVQRELFEVEHPTPVVGVANLFVEEVARASDARLHVIYSRHQADAGTYQLATLESAPYPLRPPPDAADVAGTVEVLSAVEYLLERDEGDSAATAGAVGALEVQDLILIQDQEPEEATASGAVAVLLVLDLLILVALPPDGAIVSGSPVTAEVQTFMIEAPPQDPDGAMVGGAVAALSVVAL